MPGDSGNTRATADLISDFSHAENDKIDLSGLGASRFIGADAFTGHAGEIRYEGTNVMVDLNGDRVTDFHLIVNTNSIPLVANDFVL
jgi:hypothetical protein